MGALWKTMLPLGLLLLAVGFIAGAVVASGTGEPPARRPVDMGVESGTTTPSDPSGTSPSDPSSDRPSDRPSNRSSNRPPRTPSPEVPVVTPRPGGADRDDDDDDRDDDDGERDDDDD